MAEDYAFGAVQSYDQCRGDKQCAHCAAGRPSAPVEAGDPRTLSSAVWELDEELRLALPPAFHRPNWLDTLSTPGWFCACCWTDDGTITQWPCQVVTAHGRYVARAMRLELAGVGAVVAA